MVALITDSLIAQSDRSRCAINGSSVSAGIGRSRCTIGRWVWGSQKWLALAKLRSLSLLQMSVCTWRRVKLSYMRGCCKVWVKVVNWGLKAKVITWRSVTQMFFLAFSHQYQQSNTTVFPKPLTTFLTCSSRGERRRYAGEKVRLKRVPNSQPPGHDSYTLTTEPPGWVRGCRKGKWRSRIRIHRHCPRKWKLKLNLVGTGQLYDVIYKT